MRIRVQPAASQAVWTPDRLGPPERPEQLLTDDVTYPGWEATIGDQKAYYVRGFTWFRTRVLGRRMNLTDVAPFIPNMKVLLAERPEWTETPFNWDEPFGFRQFVDAASLSHKRTPRFYKAVQIIVLCEAIARNFHDKDSSAPEPDEVYGHMRIQPAVSYIHGFDRSVLDKLDAKDMQELRRHTGQRSPDVFYDMADRKTVTQPLAQRTLRYFQSRHPDVILGDVDFHFSSRAIYSPARDEIVDVKESDLPEAARSE